jgi:DNA-binding response OmpR family regulator
MTTSSSRPRVVALVDGSEDTVEMVRRMLDSSGFTCLIGCQLTHLTKGRIDFERYLDRHQPEAVILDISPPWTEHRRLFETLRDNKAMAGRGLVLTTTDKGRLEEVVGRDAGTLEIVGKPYDLDQIKSAIDAAVARAREAPAFRRNGRGALAGHHNRADAARRCG